MPNYLTAKTLAEEALKEIGSFSPADQQADVGELRVALSRLEMVLNSKIGHNQTSGYWRSIDIPIEADKASYKLSDYTDENGAQYIFSINLVSSTGDVLPLRMITGREWEKLDRTTTGEADCAFVSQDNDSYIHVFPKPSSTVVTGDYTLRVRIQTFAPKIDHKGIADNDMLINPAWYLWAVTKLAYFIGRGAVIHLPESELERLKKDYKEEENNLMAGDVHGSTGLARLTEPEDF